MKKEHHELLALNALEVAGAGQLPGWVDSAAITARFGRARGESRRLLKDYVKAADLVEDVHVHMPFGLPDRHEILGRPLSPLQHFAVAADGMRGYNWDRDASLAGLELAGDIVMTALSMKVGYDPDVAHYGLGGAIMGASPMAAAVGQDHDLDDFAFPSAVEVGGYYGDVACSAAQPLQARVKAAGFCLHLTMDACCAHHACGYLMHRHTEWEEALHALWWGRFPRAADQAQLDAHYQVMARDVAVYLDGDEGAALAGAHSPGEVIAANARWAAQWLELGPRHDLALQGRTTPVQAGEVCVRAIASCLACLGLIF